MKKLHIFYLILFLLFPAITYAGTISGEVQDSLSGQPVQNAHIQIVQFNNGTPDTNIYIGVTDASGLFSIDVPTNGLTTIDIHHPEYMPMQQGPFIYSGNSVSFLFLLHPIPQGTGLVSGIVVDDSTGLPVASAEVILHPAQFPGPAFTALTDPSGNFEVSGILPGEYLLTAHKMGYFPFSYADSIVISDGTQLTDLLISLIPMSTLRAQISGMVFSVQPDSSVQPIQNCAIQFFADSSAGTLTYITHSLPDGSYQIEDMLPGNYMVILEAPGHQPLHLLNYMVNPGVNTHDFYMHSNSPPPGSSSLAGVVYSVSSDSSVTPLPMADIFLEGHNGFGFQTISNPDGTYFIDNIIAGNYDILVHHPEHLPVAIPNVEITDGPDTINIYMNQPDPQNMGTVSGTVLFDGSGSPVQGVEVDIIPNNTLPFMVSTLTDENGNYTADVPAGEYFVHMRYMVDGGTYFYEEFFDDVQQFIHATPVQINEGQTTGNIDFGIPPVVTTGYDVVINGTVLDGQGNPLADAEVFAFREAWFDSTTYNAVSGADGTYSITISGLMLPQAHFIVKADKQGYLTEFYDEKPTFYLADRLMVQGSLGNQTFDNIDFTLDQVGSGTLSISGTVLDSTLNPLGNGFVLLINAVSGWMTVTSTGPDGSYQFDNLNNSVYFVLYAAEGYIPEFYDDAIVWENADPIILQNSVTGIDALLNPVPQNGANGSIAGTITAVHNGDPVDGVLISAKDENGNIVGFAFSGQNGLYEINGLPAGDFTVFASKVQFNSTDGTVSLAQNGMGMLLDFDLESTVTGTDEDQVDLPTSMALGQNYPNPFNPETIIEFSLVEKSYVTIDVYNVVGQKVSTLVNDALEAGTHKVRFNAINLPSGVYVYRMQAGKFINVKKMILQK